MNQALGLVSLVVRDYDEAISFYVGILGFTLVEDRYVPEQDKRWVIVAPTGSTESGLLLARASSPDQAERIGNQTGGRVFLFLYTDDFARDYQAYTARGVKFVREPKEEPYGTVAVFEDLYGNLWDLLQPKESQNANKTASARKLGCDLNRVDAHVIAPHEYDELPELTDEMLTRATVNKGGRPQLAETKKLISLRMPEEVIQRWRATGPGWQARIADRLEHLPK
jgi:catechol 2,3-dioxygenase-like lactoylglutathione lyase family enzyme/uncharacterized protein (DUF4415 family)